MTKKVITKVIKTAGKWQKVDDLFGITMTDDKLYSIQVIGAAKLSYGDAEPTVDCFTISFPQPFTYEKKSGDDLYVLTDNIGATITIAE